MVDYSNYPTLRKGSQGSYVKTLQNRVGFLTEDGIFGDDTETVLKIYQQYNGLDVDGICGKETWAILQEQANTRLNITTSHPTLKIGSVSNDVKTVQDILRMNVSGTYDIATYKTVIKFQIEKELNLIDGWVGPETWNALEKITNEDSSNNNSGNGSGSSSGSGSGSSNSNSGSSSDSSNGNSDNSNNKSSDSNSDGGDSDEDKTDDGDGTYIKKPIRKAIKTMARVAQIANAVSQIPQPKDFALMITSDVIYMSGKVQELTENLRELLDAYTDIPFDYLEYQLNGVMNTATGILDRVDSYATTNINEAMKFAENTVNMPTALVNTSINMYYTTSQTVLSITKNTSALANIIEGDTESASEIRADLKDSIEILKNKNISAQENNPLTKVADAIDQKRRNTVGYVDSTIDQAKSSINRQYQQIQDWINKIKENVDEFSKSVDTCFGVSTTGDSAAVANLKKLASLKDGAGDDEFDKLATTLVSESAKVTDSIIENFSIGKFVTACGGMTASILLVQTGLDRLPPISTEKIMSSINGIERKLVNSSVDFDDLVQYSPEAYKKYQEQFEEELKVQRNKIREKMSNKQKKLSLLNELKANNRARKEYLKKLKNGDYSGQSSDELKSGIKQIRKKRKEARKGKRAKKLKDTILAQLKKFYEELKSLVNGVKEKWTSMMNNYKNSVKEIKKYFSKKGAGGNEAIERICDDIEQNYCDIVKLCKEDLPIQMAQVSVNVTLPRALGMCSPNFTQHMVQWFADIKIIIKFIMDLIKYVMNIINDINKLVAIILNGINNFNEIFAQLMKLLSLDWLLNLIEKIQNNFGKVIATTADLLENTLEPVYFEDTDDYEEMMDAIDNLLELELPEGQTTKSYVQTIYSYVAGNSKLSNSLSSALTYDLARDIYNQTESEGIEDKIEKLEDTLDEMGKTIVAYRSVVFKRDENNNYIYSDSTENKAANNYLSRSSISEPKIKGYLYYHPDLYHFDVSCFGGGFLGGLFAKARRRRKSRYIKKAAKMSNRERGGVYMLKHKSKLFKNRKTNKNVSAWDAFYWYMVTTEDIDVDFLGTDNTETNISKVVFNTKTGSVVLVDLGNGNTQKVFVENANVKSGDYVNYNGKKYKIL